MKLIGNRTIFITLLLVNISLCVSTVLAEPNLIVDQSHIADPNDPGWIAATNWEIIKQTFTPQIEAFHVAYFQLSRSPTIGEFEDAKMFFLIYEEGNDEPIYSRFIYYKSITPGSFNLKQVTPFPVPFGLIPGEEYILSLEKNPALPVYLGGYPGYSGGELIIDGITQSYDAVFETKGYDLEGPDSLQLDGYSENSIALQWSKNNCDDTLIRRQSGSTPPSSTNEGQLVPTNTNDEQVTDDGLTINSQYSYSAWGEFQDCYSSDYETLTVWTAPDAPSSLNPDAGLNEIELGWTIQDSPSVYIVYNSQHPPGGTNDGTVIIASTSHDSVLIEDLHQRTTYYFKVWGYRNDGGTEYFSEDSITDSETTLWVDLSPFDISYTTDLEGKRIAPGARVNLHGTIKTDGNAGSISKSFQCMLQIDIPQQPTSIYLYGTVQNFNTENTLVPVSFGEITWPDTFEEVNFYFFVDIPVCRPAEDAIDEWNENNNVNYNDPYILQATGPDLEIIDCTMSPPHFDEDYEIKITFQVKNVGDWPSEKACNAVAYFYGNAEEIYDTVTVPALKEGVTSDFLSLSFDWPFEKEHSDVTLVIDVDPVKENQQHGVIREYNENNKWFFSDLSAEDVYYDLNVHENYGENGLYYLWIDDGPTEDERFVAYIYANNIGWKNLPEGPQYFRSLWFWDGNTEDEMQRVTDVLIDRSVVQKPFYNYNTYDSRPKWPNDDEDHFVCAYLNFFDDLENEYDKSNNDATGDEKETSIDCDVDVDSSHSLELGGEMIVASNEIVDFTALQRNFFGDCTCSWQFSDSPSVLTGSKVQRNFRTSGPVDISVTVTDEANESLTVNTSVLVKRVIANQVIEFTNLNTSTPIDISDDSYGVLGLDQYSYNCGDGRVLNYTSALAQIPSYSEDGLYSLSLTVSDRLGNTHSLSQQIRVESVAPEINITSSFPNCSLGIGQQWPIEFSVMDLGNISSGVSNVTLSIKDQTHTIVFSEELKLSENGTVSYLLPGLNAPGTYRYTIRAMDNCKNINETVFTLTVGTFFGSQIDLDTGYLNVNGTLAGNIFSVPFFTEAFNVSVFGRVRYEDNVSLKALLFRLNDSTLISETETAYLNHSPESDWHMLDFVNTTFLHSGCDYAVCIIGNGSFLCEYQTVDKQIKDAVIECDEEFDSPGLIDPSEVNQQYLIYCDVEYVGGAP